VSVEGDSAEEKGEEVDVGIVTVVERPARVFP
jgi:hypothetical protein